MQLIDTSKPNLGIQGLKWTLVKQVGNVGELLPRIRLTEPIVPQIKQQLQLTGQALMGRAQNHLVQVINQGVVDYIQHDVLGKKRVELISDYKAVEQKSNLVSAFNNYVTDYIALGLKDNQYSEFNDGHAIIRVRKNKNIINTMVQGRDRGRKEIVSGGDLYITVSGKIVSDQPDVLPIDVTKKLEEILERKEVIPCQSPMLDILGVNGLLVTSYEISQREGFRNVVDYSFQAIAEASVNIQVEEQKKREKDAEKKIKEANGWVILESAIERTNLSKLAAGLL